MQKLAKKAKLRSNYMLLPNRKMQSRGIMYGDAMAPTLYQCFDNGKFSQYFTDSKGVRQWVKREKLDMLFKGDIYDKEHIISMIAGWSTQQSFKRTRKRDLLLGVMDYSNNFLDARQELFD